MKSETANKRVDTVAKEVDTLYKQGLHRYEPWQVAMTAFAAGAGLTLALYFLLGWAKGG